MTKEPNNNDEQVVLPDIEDFDSEISINNPNYKAEVSGRKNKNTQEQVDESLKKDETREGATEPDNGASAGLKDDPPAIRSEHPERPSNLPKTSPGANVPGSDKSVEPNEGEIPEKNDAQDNDGKNVISETPSSPTPVNKTQDDSSVDKTQGDNPEKPLSPLERFNKKSGNANQNNTGGNVIGKSPNMPQVPQVKNVNGNPISKFLSSSMGNVNDSISNKALEDSLTGRLANRFKTSQDFMTNLPGRTGEENSMGTIARQIQSAQKNIGNIQKNFEKIGKGAKSVGSLLGNPIFWIAVAIIIILVFIGVTPTFVGSNDNKVAACNGVSISSNLLNVKADESGYARLSENEKKNNAYIIMSWLMSNNFDLKGGEPLSKEEAAAIVGNMWKESQMNPAASQNNWAVENGKINIIYRGDISLNNVSGKAVGLIQWDGVRRANYSNFANWNNLPSPQQSTTPSWTDPRKQLEFLQKELNEGGERYNQMATTTFFDSTTSLEDKTRIFNKVFEGSADGENGISLRIKYAKMAYKFATDVSAVGANCNFGDIPTDLVELATSMAPDSSLEGYSARAKAGVLTGGSYGATQAKALSEESDPYRFSNYYNVYIEADKIKKEPLGAKPENFLYASCDRFVAAAIILTVDEKFPWGSPFEQYNYMKNSTGWLEVSSFSQLQAGDIMVTTSNATGKRHVLMYIGDYTDSNGTQYTNVVAAASSRQRIGAMNDNYGGMSAYSDGAGHTAIDTLGRPYKIFRFKG